jgi:amidase
MRRAVAICLVLAACSGDGATSSPTVVATSAPSSTVAASTSTAAPSPTTVATTLATVTSTIPPDPFDPLSATIPQLQEAMEQGRLSSEQLVRWYLDRIERLDPELTVFVTVADDAVEQAIALDVERDSLGSRGPLHGIPVVLKDNITTVDLPTTAGSVALDGWVSPDEARQVRKLRAAGAIIIGKVNLQEWARSIHGHSSVLGRTLNPYDPGRNVGGSSAGTAVAVTTEMAAVGLGTDTCGSIRIPSSYASLWGLRPTIGLSSRSGVIPLSTSEDTVGPMTRSVVDLAIVLDATVGEDSDDATTLGAADHIPGSYLDALDPDGLAGARIGVVYSLFGSRGPVYETVEAALGRMESAGATLVPIEIPDRTSLLGNATSAFLREWPFATETFFAARPGAPITSLKDVLESGQFLPETRGALERAVAVETLGPDHAAAIGARSAVATAVMTTMDEYELDVLAYPVISISPAPIGVNQRGNNCATASVAGLPAIAMPAGTTPEGLPVGVEFLGRAWDEVTLLRLASGWEATADPRVPPPQVTRRLAP